ncbi:MAG: DUF2157 domain-containing protein [Lentisphaerae bacterium]|nr:DUF2157 domain-containing protein [Lentisphaerota bacterium]MCP4103380.1 DUF2157 domain-containing protein [Lentisphaerota bacterium]
MAPKKSYINWLLDELPGLKENNIIDEDNCSKLQDYYSKQIPPAVNYQRLMIIIFGALSAILVMGGVLLLIAHNWEDIPLRVRLSLAFVPLVASLTFGWYTKLDDRSTVWQEASAVLISGSFAAAVAMVSQIYYLGGELYQFMFTCLLFTFPLLYIFKSQVYLTIYLIGLTIYTYSSIRNDSVAYSWMFFAFILPYSIYYIVKEFRSAKMQFLCNIIVAFVLINFAVFFHECKDSIAKVGWATLLPAILFLGKQFERKGLLSRKNSLLVVGFLGIAIFMALGSFDDFWRNDYFNWKNSLSDIGITAISILLFLWMLIQTIRWRAGSLLMPLILPLAAASSWYFDDEIIRYVFSAIMIAYGIMLLVKSCNLHKMALLNLGMLLIAVQILIQFFDPEVPILFRAAGFIITGVAFMIVNIILSRRFKKAETAKGGTA